MLRLKGRKEHTNVKEQWNERSVPGAEIGRGTERSGKSWDQGLSVTFLPAIPLALDPAAATK